VKRSALLFVLVIASIGLVPGASTAADASPSSVVRLKELDQAILDGLNAARASHGLRRLVLSDSLQRAAAAHSQSMLQAGYFAHESKNGSSFVARVKRYYSPSGYTTWSAGENLLYNTADVDATAAIEAWLASPPHRENMLDPRWREVGIASLHADSAGGTFGGGPTWVITMDFGARSGGLRAVKLASKSRAV
jgi:uncharacterized protein YkwD